MQTKYEQYSRLCEETLNGLLSDKNSWLSFLDTASRMYKYNFEDQILIHAQRPECKACADFDFWTGRNRMNRHIRKGSKAITLIDRDTHKTHYVYAVEDTEARSSGLSKNPDDFIWRIDKDRREVVNAALCSKLKINSDSLEKTITSIAVSMTNSKLKYYDEEFEMLCRNNNISSEVLRKRFRDIIANSSVIMSMKRCGISTDRLEANLDFAGLSVFPPDFAALIGKATADVSAIVIRTAENVVKAQQRIERGMNNEQRGNITKGNDRERDTLHSGRENTDLYPGLSGQRTGEDTHREIRKDEGKISSGTLRRDIQQNADEKRTDSSSDISRGASDDNGRADNGRTGGSGWNERGTESDRSDEVGRSNEQLQTNSTGNNPGGTDRENVIEEITAEAVASAVSFAGISYDSSSGTITENTHEKIDFTITDENLSIGGPKTKYKANIDAIKLLKQLEHENRFASAEEQKVLAKYVGWGGLKNAFENFHDDWKKENAELKALLTEKEYASAVTSVLDAYYTSPRIIESIYTVLENNGFNGGRILEPAMGIGNFFGKMPEEMRKNSQLYGVEIDSISGRIAKELYQNADIRISGFEKTNFSNAYFDLAVGNVPFGSHSLYEKEYSKYNFRIHDYFFAKSLDKVKPGGIVAFVTSTGTLDRKNPDVRKYLAQRAELVGAIRLPGGTFKENAGTDVASDIIFLQKRPEPIELTSSSMPDWISLGETENGVPVNLYFAEHPEMILGEMTFGNKMYGRADSTTCIPFENSNLKELLDAAVKNIHFNAAREESVFIDVEAEKTQADTVPVPLGTKNFSYVTVQDKLYFRDNEIMQPFDGNKKDENRIRGMIKIRDTLRELIQAQLDNADDITVRDIQEKLNYEYDSFVSKNGRLNEKANKKAFGDDASLPLLASLEEYKGAEFKCKAAIFDHRTIHAKTEIDHVETANEALAVSLSEKAFVDIEFMQHLTGKTKDELLSALKNVVYENPMKSDETGNPVIETADEYLSGNILSKLEFLKVNYPEDPRYTHNIAALEKVMPVPLQAADIDIKLGACWLDPKLIQKFMYETFKTPVYMQQRNFRKDSIRVEYCDMTSLWNITNKSDDKYNQAANSQYGTNVRSAYALLEDCLNLKSTVVRDRIDNPDGTHTYVTNRKETEYAQEKQRELQNRFREWIYEDPERREQVVAQYNRIFNSSRPREYDGSHLSFPGMNSEVTLRKHQKDAVARALYGGNTLFAHEVGAGKTYEMIAAAMEGKRLGLHNKVLMCVPNHLTEQIGSDFIHLYPGANILVATSKDFQKKNRKKLFAKIATGDYDAVIIGHSQLSFLPISKERQERLINEQIQDVVDGIAALKEQNGEDFQIKQLVKVENNLRVQLQALLDSPKDDTVTFEELGIDKLILDEAHEFKNLLITTKLSNISGISTNSDVKKTADLLMKCRYLDELTGGKGIIFATGTPVSNSISEIYTMMKYLQSDLLNEKGLKHFDAWAANFADIVTEPQLTPEGTGYQQKTRFAHFNNLPELMSLFKETADIKTSDQLGLKIPECELKTVVAKPSDIQKAIMEQIGERAERIRCGSVNPKQDNMLNIVNDGKKNGLDPRILNPDLPDFEDSKVNLCVKNVFDIWKDTADDRLTQLIFCDMSTPKSAAEKQSDIPSFSVYDDIKDKLIKSGVPENEIAFIHDAKSETEKDKLFAKVRSGEIRILMGSTKKMGAGTNVQDRLIASHDLDAPYRPSDMEQRRGRMVRQGNMNEKVHLYRYVTEGTFDSYSYQILENKQAFGSQIMTSKSPVRSCDDVDDVQMSFATAKALCVNNPLIKERMELENSLNTLKMLKASHMNMQYTLQDKVSKELPAMISAQEYHLECMRKDKQKADSYVLKLGEDGKPIFQGVTVRGTYYAEKEAGGSALHDAVKEAVAKNISGKTPVGEYKGFDLVAAFDPMSRLYVVYLKGAEESRTEMGSSETGLFTRLDNVLNNLGKKIEQSEAQLVSLKEQLETAEKQINKPFGREQELQEKSKRLEEVILQIEYGDELKKLESIVDPYFIELRSTDDLEKLKKAGIKHDFLETKDGKLIAQVAKNDSGKVKSILNNSMVKR